MVTFTFTSGRSARKSFASASRQKTRSDAAAIETTRASSAPALRIRQASNSKAGGSLSDQPRRLNCSPSSDRLAKKPPSTRRSMPVTKLAAFGLARKHRLPPIPAPPRSAASACESRWIGPSGRRAVVVEEQLPVLLRRKETRCKGIHAYALRGPFPRQECAQAQYRRLRGRIGHHTGERQMRRDTRDIDDAPLPCGTHGRTENSDRAAMRLRPDSGRTRNASHRPRSIRSYAPPSL